MVGCVNGTQTTCLCASNCIYSGTDAQINVTARSQLKSPKEVCVCVCLKDGEVSRDPPASSPRVLVALPDASQCFHGVLEMEGDSLIYHTTTHTQKEREITPTVHKATVCSFIL